MILSLFVHGLLLTRLPIHSKNPEIAFKRGEIAMELLKPHSSLPSARAKGPREGTLSPSTNTAATEGSSPQTIGISTGTELGITSPEYPLSSQKKGEEGDAIIHFNLNSKGEWVTADIELSTGFSSLDDSALNAITNHYEKAKDPSPPLSPFRVKFKFRLKK